MSAGKASAQPLSLGTVATPLGTICILCSDAGVVMLSLPEEDPARFETQARRIAGPAPVVPARDHAFVAQMAADLKNYFDGLLQVFTVPLDARGTDFQRSVWEAVCAVPYGATTSYAEIARRIGRPAAPRAVGHANGSNRLPIVVPCHRLVGANGSLTGYAGGLPMKRWLIDHERRVAGASTG